MEQENSIVHVAVAVIIKNNKVLIARRPSHVHQGNLWEFPGGKVEPGESVRQALYREIKEELGIEILYSEPLISVLYHYKDKSVLLDTWKVINFAGRNYESESALGSGSTGLENQPIEWVEIDRLNEYSFPVANKAILNAVSLPDVYLITPDTDQSDRFISEFEKVLFSLGAPQALVQLRIFSLQGLQLELVLIRACDLAHAVNVRVILNAGMMADAELSDKECTRLFEISDGLHLPAWLLSGANRPELKMIKMYRQKFADKLFSASCHNQHEIGLANQAEVDYIVLSPVQRTASHPDALPLGWERFADLAESAQSPVYALGGLGLQNLARAKKSGAQGIAAISALWLK